MTSNKKRLYLHSRNIPGNIHEAVAWINEMGLANLVLFIHPVPGGRITVVVWRSTIKPTQETI